MNLEELAGSVHVASRIQGEDEGTAHQKTPGAKPQARRETPSSAVAHEMRNVIHSTHGIVLPPIHSPRHPNVERRRPVDHAHSIGAELLEKMWQPMILIDHERRIGYRNRTATALLARRDAVFESDGMLACRERDSELALMLAVRELLLIRPEDPSLRARDRISLKLAGRDGSPLAAIVLALNGTPGAVASQRRPWAVFTVFEPRAEVEIDPFLLTTTFGLTPAEARLVVLMVNGSTPEDCARELNVKISTVRSQLVSIYGKTAVSGQADLVRLVMSAIAF